jgi:hypothetical protein
MTDMLPPPALLTYTRDPFGLTATAVGDRPTATVPITLLDDVSITANFDVDLRATYARLAVGLSATADAVPPTGTVDSTAPVAVLTTDTDLSDEFAT